ncbi:uncharacterized protein GIQ15_04167 [Arthroderma uncinatum]|uniref:uncharacterized protein n=1 Tax=Arthroderma uncinatum TaxID=74035 RepID=UPI00144A8521|nr:uncharacterized protein GIQ15_04167 [Arthroderma uncinatum]KAF3481408.1 hypothetical protein GIQ15_04167 [Arthroderma uncinatum]
MDLQSSQPGKSYQRRSIDPSSRLNGKQMASELSSQFARPNPRLHALNDGVHIPAEYRHIANGQGSSANHHDGAQRSSSAAGSPFVNPTSALLQNLINEQRASRGPRASSACEHHVESSPLASNQTPNPTANTNAHGKWASGKWTRQYVSKLNKLNFDLKLEVFHRAQQVASLEKKLERMQELEEQVQQMDMMDQELQELRGAEEDNQRLRESNEELRSELDKRDQAVNEAVELICQLEAKLEAFEAKKEDERPSTARPYSSDGNAGFATSSPQALTPKNKIILDVPERTSSRRGMRPSKSRSFTAQAHTPTSSSRRPCRQPSFLQAEDNNTSVLRNVYMTDADKSRAAFSAFSGRGTVLSDDGTHEIESPRLSALSECSYLDPPHSPSDAYGPGVSKLKINTNHPAKQVLDEPPSPLELTHNGSKPPASLLRIEQWIHPNNTEAPRPTKPSERHQADALLRTPTNNQFVLPGASFQNKRSPKTYNFDPPALVIPQFTTARLPPTPDTMSTSYADLRNKSNTSIIAERSRYDRPTNTRRSLSIDRVLGRRRSADDVATTRPSTAETILSDGLETWSDSTQPAFITEESYQMASMFPSFAYTHRPTGRHFDPAAHAGAVNGLGVITPKHNNRHFSEKHSSGQVRKVSNTLSLTPEDWLEAALPASSNGPSSKPSRGAKDTKADQHEALDPADEDPGSPQLGAQQVPLNHGFRTRGARVLSELQPRKRINLRPPFFNRNPTYSPTNPVRSNSIAVPTPSSAGHPPAVSGTLPNEHITSPNSGTVRRPKTSETNEHKRRSSHGFFGWMKGSGAMKDADPTQTPPATATSTSTSTYNQHHTEQQPHTQAQRMAARGVGRPGSALAYTTELSSSPTDVNPMSAALADETSDRRSRFSVRRTRR